MANPRFAGSVCLSVNPRGCSAGVRTWIEQVCASPALDSGPKSVLVLGCSGGYGLAARIVAAFGARAQTFGVSFERPATVRRGATPGWYNNLTFDLAAAEAGVFSETLVADAFLDSTREKVIELVKARGMAPFDLVIYSLAAPQRTDPATGITYRSVIKPIGKPLAGKTLDVASCKLEGMVVEPATDEEIEATVKVMGGEDWKLWMQSLQEANLLAEGVSSVAFSYIGPESTYAVYRSGTLGRAKEHLERSADEISAALSPLGGVARVAVCKALITRASSVIPIMSVYVSVMYRVMKRLGLHEGCLEQMSRLFRERLYSGDKVQTDSEGRIRVDDWELRPDVQAEISAILERVTDDNLAELADTDGCRQDLLALYGF